jgi:hypothetical protein
MRKIHISIIAVFFILIALPSWAVDRETIDNLTFILTQPGPIHWADMDIDDATLIEAFNEIYATSVDNGDDGLRAQVVWAMGETGIVDFVPTIIGVLEYDPSTACYALGKISSDDGAEALIGMLDNEDMFVREAAIWGLGKMPYLVSMDDSKANAVAALENRLESETEDWLKDLINAAITFIQTGVATDPAFDTSMDGLML